MRRLLVSLVTTAVALATACLPCCGDTQAGNVNQPMTAEPLAFYGNGWEPVEDGKPFQTVIGGQGFTMMVVGARAQNIDTCGVGIKATLTRTDTNKVVYEAENEKNLTMVDETTAESTDPDGEQGVQLIPCGYAIEDGCVTPVRLDVTLTDRLGHTVTTSRTGTFDCGQRFGGCQTDAGTDAGVDGGP